MTLSKILIDVPEGTEINEQFLKDSGHPVVICHGPQSDDCPLVVRGECHMAEEAHGIVFMLDLERPHHRDILDRYRTILRDDLPIGVVVKDREQASKYAALLKGLRIWDHAPAAGDLDALAARVEASERS